MSHGKQFTLFTHNGGGPNGWKAMAVLEELGLTYEPIYLEYPDMKKPEYTKYNPNGRIPAIIDHKNGDLVIWESNAIIQYLVDKYDPEGKVSVLDPNEKYKQLQWLFFQASGQGPYYGQFVWFNGYHQEKLPSAVERYKKEIRRVLGVLESVLSKQEWLVGGKPTVADIAFVSWHDYVASVPSPLGEDFDFEQEFPATAAWHRKLTQRPAVKKVSEVREAILKGR